MAVDSSPRTKILNIASELFYQRGFHAVGVDEIVSRSGVAKTTLYAHFLSKDQLIASYIQLQSDDWRIFLEAELKDDPGIPAERIDKVFMFLAEGCADPTFRGCPFINFAAEFPDPNHPAWAICLEHRHWLKGLLTGLAEEGGAADPTGLAIQLCHLYDAAMVGTQFEPAGDDAERARATARTLVALAFSS